MTDGALARASLEQLFVDAGALLEGHFLLKSGRHAARYLEKFLVLQHPAYGVEIGRRMASELARYRPSLVVGPTTGGVLLSFEVARQLGGDVRAAFAEPLADGGRSLRRGWAIGPDERIVVVDDILTTGASLRETVTAITDAGARPLAAAVIVDRSAHRLDLGLPIHALGTIEMESWEAAECPLCAGGSVPRKPGSS